MVTKWPEESLTNALLDVGSKVSTVKGVIHSHRGQNCLGIPCGYQIYTKEPLTRMQRISGVKRRARVI